MKRFVVVENPPKSRAVPAFRPVVFTRGRARRNVMPMTATTALNPRSGLRIGSAAWLEKAGSYKSRTKARIKRAKNAWKFKKITKKKSAGVPRASRRRGNANRGGSKMATAKQRAAQRKFVARFAGKKSRKKRGRRARQNKRGRPLSGRSYRPTLPKGPLRVIVKTVKRKYKKSLSRASRAGKKAAKKRRKTAARRGRARAKKNPVYTVFNNGRRRGKRLSASRARAMSMKRWHGKRKSTRRRRSRRNFGGGIISAFKSALSMRTAKSGLAVLAGAVVATGAPSLFGSWNSGYAGIGLSILTAAAAAVAAGKFAPAYATEVASGGIVVVGLRLVAQFLPKALSWQSAVSGVQAGFLLPARNASARSGVGGYLPPPPGAVSLVGRGRVSGFARAAGEGFKSPRI